MCLATSHLDCNMQGEVIEKARAFVHFDVANQAFNTQNNKIEQYKYKHTYLKKILQKEQTT